MKLEVPLVLILSCVALTLGESSVRVTKTTVRNNGKVLVKAKCVYRIDTKYPVGEAQFTITMDTALSKFKSKQVSVIIENGTFFEVINAKVMRPDRFVAIFSGQYLGDATTPIPTGVCSDLTFPGTTTPIPTTEPTPAPTYAVRAAIQSDSQTTKCHTVQVTCNLSVDATLSPGTVFFNLTFSKNVGRFQDNYGTYIAQASEPGRWIYTSNKFELAPPSFAYAFQITYHGDPEPEIYCNSILPELNAA